MFVNAKEHFDCKFQYFLSPHVVKYHWNRMKDFKNLIDYIPQPVCTNKGIFAFYQNIWTDNLFKIGFALKYIYTVL